MYNRILLTAFIAWLLSQLSKTLIYAIINKKFSWERFRGDGGMPSSHSAVVMSVATITGLQLGWDSPLFAIAATKGEGIEEWASWLADRIRQA